MLHRQAALTVHALSAHDRSWLLDRLDAGQRETLEPLLSELAELGVPVDTSLLAAAAASAAPRAPAPTGLAGDAAWLDRCTAQQVCAALANEPAVLAARLLAMRDWRWRDDVAASLGQPRIAGPKPHKLEAAIVQALAVKLRAMLPQSLAADVEIDVAGGGWGERLRRLLPGKSRKRAAA